MKIVFQFAVGATVFTALCAEVLDANIAGPTRLPVDFNPNVRNPSARDLSGVPVHSVKPFTKAFLVTGAKPPEMSDVEAGDLKIAGSPYYSPADSPVSPNIIDGHYTKGNYEQTGKGPRGSANGGQAKPDVEFSITPYLHYEYANMEFVSTVEWHCIERSSIGWSVHGTYDNLGYFDGVFRADGMARISYYENSVGLQRNQWKPTTGAGLLKYDPDTHLFLGGDVWGAGQASIVDHSIDSWQGYYGVHLCYDCMPDESSKWEMVDWIKFARKVCLWSPYDQFHRTMQGHILTNEIFGPKGNENTWTSDGVGPAQTNGSTIGAYTHTYSEEECDAFEEGGVFSCEDDGRHETGNYGLNAVSAFVGNNRVFVSSWTATTGPLRGQSGPLMGVFQSNVRWGYDELRSQFNGIFCYGSYYQLNGIMVAPRCVSQISHNQGRDKKLADKLLSTYDIYKESKKTYRLKWLVDMIWG